MRARYPDAEGYVARDGVKLFYEVFGEGEPTVLRSDRPLEPGRAHHHDGAHRQQPAVPVLPPAPSFEQNVHVRHRLNRYGAGRCMDFATSTPEVIAAAIAEEIGRPVSYRPIDPLAATRIAARIVELI